VISEKECTIKDFCRGAVTAPLPVFSLLEIALRVEYLKNIPKVVTAYDNDDLGHETARALQQLLPQATRLRPQGQDWNSDLLQRLYTDQQLHQHQQPDFER